MTALVVDSTNIAMPSYKPDEIKDEKGEEKEEVSSYLKASNASK